MIIRNDGTFATLRADIFSALIKKYIVRLVCNLIKSSWLIPDGFRITTLGGGVRNSFPFCRLFDSIQGSSVTINISYIKTAGEGNNSKGFTGTWAFPLNFNDADQVSEWADEAMHWMIMNGIIQGMSDKELSPQGDALRAQVATMLMRFSQQLQA